MIDRSWTRCTRRSGEERPRLTRSRIGMIDFRAYGIRGTALMMPTTAVPSLTSNRCSFDLFVVKVRALSSIRSLDG